MNKFESILLVLLMFTLGACNTISPHDNFKRALNSTVGTSLDDQKINGQWLVSREPIAENRLPNGNIEYTYLYMTRFKCMFAFEIENKTRKIVNARIVSGEHDCFINP
jgi:hypothetical protein